MYLFGSDFLGKIPRSGGGEQILMSGGENIRRAPTIMDRCLARASEGRDWNSTFPFSEAPADNLYHRERCRATRKRGGGLENRPCVDMRRAQRSVGMHDPYDPLGITCS